MPDLTALILVRHAETTGQAPDAPLSDAGFEQARALAPALAALYPTDLWTSPYLRARQTLEPFAQEHALPLREVAELRERTLSPVPLDDFKAHLRRGFKDPDYAPEGGESHRVLLARVHAGLDQILRDSTGTLPAAVTHGGVLGCLLNSIDPAFGFEDMRAIANPDLFRLEFADNRPAAFTRIPLE